MKFEELWTCPRYKEKRAIEESRDTFTPYDEKITVWPPYKCPECIGPLINHRQFCFIVIDTEIVKTKQQRLRIAKKIARGLRKTKSRQKRRERAWDYMTASSES